MSPVSPWFAPEANGDVNHAAWRKEYSHLRDHIIANEDFTKHPRDLPRTTSALPSDLTSQTKTFLHIENSHDLISFV
jgi:hypothetical protein